MDEVETRVIELLVWERWVSASKLVPTSRLLQDLGMDGDDPVEFLEAFSERFSPDLQRRARPGVIREARLQRGPLMRAYR